MSARPVFRVVKGSVESRDDVVELFRLTGEHSGWVYPPAVRIQQEGSLAGWVWLSENALRWDAVTDSNILCGSCQLHLLNENVDTSEIWQSLASDVAVAVGRDVGVGELGVVERLVVHPLWRGRGCGAALLREALSEARALGKTPVLDVLCSQREAFRLYEQEGGVVVSQRVGRSGNPIARLVFSSLTKP